MNGNFFFNMMSNKYIKHNGIKVEKPIDQKKDSPSYGKLWQYVSHTSESNIVLKIIKYIKKHKQRITLIGIDNDTLARDYDMYKNIMDKLDNNCINFLWAHNAHVDDRKLSIDTYKWIKKEYPKLKYYCGHYLKKKLKNDYCIILSQAYSGENRFNSYCSGYACETRQWRLNYFYKKFKYKPNKKYVNKNNVQLLTKFNNKLIEFSNSYYKDNGYQQLVTTNKWNYILFWNKVTKLDAYYEYN